MIRRWFLITCSSIFLLLSLTCSRHSSNPKVTIDVPAGFTGNFVLVMGVRGAAPLEKQGDTFMLTVSQSGRRETSTWLENPSVSFKNGSDGRIWGFSQSVFATGDGISVGGKIEFFVGTRQEFEAEQNKKNKSGRFFGEPSPTSI
jgi:hypothetical protein